MKKIFLTLTMMFVLTSVTYASRGVVAFYNSGTNKIIIATSLGYTCGEVYGFYLGGRGNVVVGELESFGVQEIYDATFDTEFSMWVDQFWLDADSAVNWLREN